MAQFDEARGVAERTTKAGVKIVIQFDTELRWFVEVEAKHEALRQAVEAGYKRLLDSHTKRTLIEHDGSIGPQFGLAQGFLFDTAVREFGFEVLHQVRNRHTPGDEPVVY